MANTTIGFGVALILLGLGGFFGTGAEHKTALIPAVFGVLLAILGALARNPAKRALYMHIAVAVGLLGFLGSVPGVVKVIKMMGGETIARPVAAEAQTAMAAITLVYVALCVRSFINARRERTLAASTR